MIAVPRELNDNESRIDITSTGIRDLTLAGHEVIVGPGPGLNVSQRFSGATAIAEWVAECGNSVLADGEAVSALMAAQGWTAVG